MADIPFNSDQHRYLVTLCVNEQNAHDSELLRQTMAMLGAPGSAILYARRAFPLRVGDYPARPLIGPQPRAVAWSLGCFVLGYLACLFI